MPPPPIPGLQDGPRFVHGLQRPQRIDKDRPLLLDSEGFAERMAERVTEIKSTGRLHLLRHLFLERDPHRRNAFYLDGTLEQTHGLVAQPSGRGEDDGLRPVTL